VSGPYTPEGSPFHHEVWKELPDLEYLGLQPEVSCPRGHGPMGKYRTHSFKESATSHHCDECHSLWIDDAGEERFRRVVLDAQDAQDAEVIAASKPLNPLVYIFQVVTRSPVKLWNPLRRRPWMTWTLLASFALIFCSLEMYVLHFHGEEYLRSMFQVVGLTPVYFFQGERLWGLVTYPFFHDGWLHLTANLYFFYVFARNVEDEIGPWWFLLFFFVTAIFGGILENLYYFNLKEPLVGASGAIAGVMGAYLVFFPRVKVWMVLFFYRFRLNMIWYMGFWVLTQFLQGMAGLGGHGDVGTAWFAHLGGALAGILIAASVRLVRSRRESQVKKS
jgi:membrane associated rhomboid family serine protease